MRGQVRQQSREELGDCYDPFGAATPHERVSGGYKPKPDEDEVVNLQRASRFGVEFVRRTKRK